MCAEAKQPVALVALVARALSGLYVLALLGSLGSIPAFAQTEEVPAVRAPAPIAELYGIELCVDDLAAATALWRDTRGFAVEQDVTPQAGVVLARDGLRLWLRTCTTPTKDGPTPSLDADDAEDSTGALLHVALELADPAAASEVIARLGFAPERLVLRQRPSGAPVGGASFPGASAAGTSAASASPGSRRGAILLAVSDLAAATSALHATGADVVNDRPAPGTLGPSIAVRGPEGALFRVIERSPAVRAFERFRALAGRWSAASSVGWEEQLRIDIIAGGSAVMQQAEGAHPGETMLTVWHMDGSRLMLTHYCVSLSHPRLVATRFEDDGDTVHFEFDGATNLASRDVGHMDSIVYRFEGPDRFRSQWSWYQDGQSKPFEEIVTERRP